MKVLLHICCSVCAAGAAERLIQEGHQICGYFYNPNIYPEEEYRLRLDNAERVARELNFLFLEGPYEPVKWNAMVKGWENEPEGGRRCPVCFEMRLKKAFQSMLELECDVFATTLTMGSNKSAVMMERIGREIGGDRFLSRDFKKKDGFKRTGELARQWGLYRQHYCGCLYSLTQTANNK